MRCSTTSPSLILQHLTRSETGQPRPPIATHVPDLVRPVDHVPVAWTGLSQLGYAESPPPRGSAVNVTVHSGHHFSLSTANLAHVLRPSRATAPNELITKMGRPSEGLGPSHAASKSSISIIIPLLSPSIRVSGGDHSEGLRFS